MCSSDLHRPLRAANTNSSAKSTPIVGGAAAAVGGTIPACVNKLANTTLADVLLSATPSTDNPTIHVEDHGVRCPIIPRGHGHTGTGMLRVSWSFHVDAAAREVQTFEERGAALHLSSETLEPRLLEDHAAFPAFDLRAGEKRIMHQFTTLLMGGMRTHFEKHGELNEKQFIRASTMLLKTTCPDFDLPGLRSFLAYVCHIARFSYRMAMWKHALCLVGLRHCMC